MYVDLAFEEEVKSINFPSLDKLAENLTQEQYDVIDELIEEMDLMNADKFVSINLEFSYF